MTCPWHYDETIQVGTDYQNENEVRNYDKHMQKLRDVEAEIREIGAALGISRDSTVWEIGTGTGECALALASKARHVYATDISPAMLNYACLKAEERQVYNVTFKTGGFLSGFQPDEPVDCIASQLALHHLPDFWKARAFDTIVKKLKPKGRFFLRDVVFSSEVTDTDDFFTTVVDGIRSQAGEEVAQQTIQHIKTEYSTFDWILEGMIDRSGMKLIEKNNKGFMSVYVCEKE